MVDHFIFKKYKLDMTKYGWPTPLISLTGVFGLLKSDKLKATDQKCLKNEQIQIHFIEHSLSLLR